MARMAEWSERVFRFGRSDPIGRDGDATLPADSTFFLQTKL